MQSHVQTTINSNGLLPGDVAAQHWAAGKLVTASRKPQAVNEGKKVSASLAGRAKDGKVV